MAVNPVIAIQERLHRTPERIPEYREYLRTLLACDLAVEPSAIDDKREDNTFLKLVNFLNEYQEQPYLFDPYLEQLVLPVIEELKSHVKGFGLDAYKSYSSSRINRLSGLLYNFIKFRGYKAIIRFFPHDVSDLTIALHYISSVDAPVREPSQWALRYIVLLWLSLVCTLPFDLSQFDEAQGLKPVAIQLEDIAKLYLKESGLERDAAAILLSKLYMRRDTSQRLPEFLDWGMSHIKNTGASFIAMGVLKLMAELAKTGPVELLQVSSRKLEAVLFLVKEDPILVSNTVIRKLRAKYIARSGMRLLPPRRSGIYRKQLGGNTFAYSTVEIDSSADDNILVSEVVEDVIQELFDIIQDKAEETTVRYTAAKGLARIAERLPRDLAAQVLENLMGLFSIHASPDEDIYNMPAVAEATWHGATLTLAELARRDLINQDALPELINWLIKAVFFDIRKGAHSVGSSVRDAACYVFWSLARAHAAYALEPHATRLAQQLITCALFDREVHIRRAASAAFQENVGRMGLFPHGIDVLAKTDFFAVSIRRNAFLIAAPQVAMHNEYRSCLLEHLLTVTLRHWDPVMRDLGAQSIRLLLELVPFYEQVAFADRIANLLHSLDINEIHGGILALTELAKLYLRAESHNGLYADERRKIFNNFKSIDFKVLLSPRNYLLTEAACYLIAASITDKDINRNVDMGASDWRKIIDEGLRHRNSSVQEAAATAMASIRSQQSITRLLGVLDYTAFPHGIDQALALLLGSVNSLSAVYAADIDTRRNALIAMEQIVTTVRADIPKYISSSMMHDIISALLVGYEDYSINDRGDIGSYIRMASIQVSTRICLIMFSEAHSIPDFPLYLPHEEYHRIVGMILKQGVERLDNVRQLAGENFILLLNNELPPIDGREKWAIYEVAYFKRLLLSSETEGWQNSDWLFPKAVHFLDVLQYRQPVLKGLLMSIGSKSSSTHSLASQNFSRYAANLSISHLDDAYDLLRLISDLIRIVENDFNSNNITIPAFQAIGLLLQDDVLFKLEEVPNGSQIFLSILQLTTRNVGQLKNMQRVLECMKIVIQMISIVSVSRQAIQAIPAFMCHRYPNIRSETAEALYLNLQSRDHNFDQVEEIEEILLETEWSTQDTQTFSERTGKLIALLLA